MNRNAQLYQDAVSLGIATTPTEFWTAVRKSGLTPEAFVKLHTPQAKPAWIATDADDMSQCPYCGSRWGHHHHGCPEGD